MREVLSLCVFHTCSCFSYEELLQDTEEEEEGGRREERKTGMWLKEGSGDDPVNLLDSSLASKISC